MDEEQLREEPKLAKGIIRGHRRLRALQPEKTAPNISFLDHRNVVGTVSYREGHGIPSFLDLQS